MSECKVLCLYESGLMVMLFLEFTLQEIDWHDGYY